jgi:peptidoglycan/LPS O-acetylase OafA/YrhL
MGDVPAIRHHRSALLRLAVRLLPAIIVLTAISALTAKDFFHAEQATAAEEE